MAQAPPLTVPPFQAVSGSYRMRHPYASAGSAGRSQAPCSLGTKASQPLCPPSASQTAHHQRSHFLGRETVKVGLTAKRPRWQVENDEYSAFVRRVLRAHSRRVGDGDIETLALLVDLSEKIDAGWPRRSRACALMATPGPRLATGSALPGRPHNSGGAPVNAELLRTARRWRELGTHPPPGRQCGDGW